MPAAISGRTMGTFYRVESVGGPGAEALRVEVERKLEELNRIFSHYEPESELSRFNRSTATAPVKISPAFARVMRHSLAMSRASDGAFDPALGALINLWGFGPGGTPGRVPADAEIFAARQLCGAQHLRLNERDELQKDVPGLQLNLGGIAKGFAAYEVARVVCAQGCTNFFVSVGGEVVTLGRNGAGRPWQVGIERPQRAGAPGAALCAIVPLSGGALSTSGDAHQFFRDAQGRVFGHILDPTTGRPVSNSLASVTVLAPDGLTADSLTKPLIIMGLERGLRWIEQRPDAAALFIVRENDGRLRLVPSSRFPGFQALE